MIESTPMSQLQFKSLTPIQMQQNLPQFMQRIESLLLQLDLDVSTYQADHIALRINDTEIAQLAHQAWLGEGKVISQAEINGRPIIVLLFNSPIIANQWQIECLELPYPTAGKLYPAEGWEHIEFVIPSTAQTADDFYQELQQLFPTLEQRITSFESQGGKVKLSSPKGKGERLNNPTVAFKYDGVCIKLHPHSLKEIVESELQ